MDSAHILRIIKSQKNIVDVLSTPLLSTSHVYNISWLNIQAVVSKYSKSYQRGADNDY